MPGATPSQDQAARCAEIRTELSAAFPIDPLTDAEALELLEKYRICNSDEDTPDDSAAVGYQTQAFKPVRGEYGPLVEQWRPLVAGQFDPEDVETALCLMYHESRGDPDAKNPRSSASGLFQLLATWHDYFDIDPFVPEQNVWAAAQLQNLYGWSQWAPYTRGLCHGL